MAGCSVDLLAEVRWTMIGCTAWSGTYEGKTAVLHYLLPLLAEQFAGPNRVSAHGSSPVVVEARKHSVTIVGTSCLNRCCWVITMRDERIVAITEYTDTRLTAETLTDPPGRRP